MHPVPSHPLAARSGRSARLLLLAAAVLLLAAPLQARPDAPGEDAVHPEAERLEAALAQPDLVQTYSAADWAVLSERLVHHLAGEHDRLREGSLRLLVRYGAHLDVGAAVSDMLAIYRTHPDDDMRRLSLVALGQVRSEWAIDHLERLIRFEPVERVRHTGEQVVRAHREAQQARRAMRRQLHG